jgi:lysophospholipase L1-like esterase
MINGYIHTVGDSTLDNRFWIPNSTNPEQRTVEEALHDRVQAKGLKVISHAYDGFTTKSVLEGGEIGAVLPPSEKKTIYMHEKAQHGVRGYPLAELQQAIDANPSVHHYVVISVGGNDFIKSLENPCHLLHSISQIQQRYLQIVDTIRGLGNKNVHPILMLQYRTDPHHDPYGIYATMGKIGVVAGTVYIICFCLLVGAFVLSVLPTHLSAMVPACCFFLGSAGIYFSNRIISILAITDECLEAHRCGMVVLGELMTLFYRPILEYANQKNIPVLDLANTFNPYEKLYEGGIEPNHNGSQLIAEGIHHIIENHNFTSGHSALYSRNNMLFKRYNMRPLNAYIKERNHPSTWRIHPPTP